MTKIVLGIKCLNCDGHENAFLIDTEICKDHPFHAYCLNCMSKLSLRIGDAD